MAVPFLPALAAAVSGLLFRRAGASGRDGGHDGGEEGGRSRRARSLPALLAALLAGGNLPPEIISNLSFLGSALIFCVGVNLVWGKRIRVANLLPALVVAVAYALLGL